MKINRNGNLTRSSTSAYTPMSRRAVITTVIKKQRSSPIVLPMCDARIATKKTVDCETHSDWLGRHAMAGKAQPIPLKESAA